MTKVVEERKKWVDEEAQQKKATDTANAIADAVRRATGKTITTSFTPNSYKEGSAQPSPDSGHKCTVCGKPTSKRCAK